MGVKSKEPVLGKIFLILDNKGSVMINKNCTN